MPLAGISFIFPRRKVQMSSGSLGDRMLFHQLGTCEYECFRLAGALVADANEKAILLETLAAGKYLWTSRLHFCLAVPGARLG